MTAKKLHFGPLEKGKPFLTFHGTMKRADLAFYEGYDPNFIWKKVAALFGIYKNAASFKECALSCGWPFDATEEGFLGALATEIHCAGFHQIEGLIALLLAEYQDRPDWVYLTSYGNADMKTAARAFAKGDFEKITNGAHKTAEEFVCAAVYAGFKTEDSAHEEDWKSSVSDITWLIGHCAEHFVEGTEYNAYKHGLRVVSGSANLAVRPMESEGQFTSILSMRHSLSYLEIADGTDGYTAERVTKELNPEYSCNVIEIVAGVLAIVREMRLARIRGKADSITCLSFDREELVSRRPSSKMSFSY